MAKQKKIHRVTLQDVANSCKLSVPTVSQILNNKASNFSSEKTRLLVKETAKKLGYTPNLGYKIMRGISTKTAAIVTGRPICHGEEYLKNLLYLLMDKLSRKGYSVYTGSIQEKWSERREILRSFIQRGAEHLITFGKVCEWEDLDELEESTGVTVMTYDTPHRNSVRMNVALGFENLLRHYQVKGCKKIRAIICQNEPRIQAIQSVFGENMSQEIMVEIPRPDCHADAEDFLSNAISTGYNMTQELLAKEPDTDAILYLSDYFALGGAKYILETNRTIGKDIYLAGFNNTPAAKAYPYPVSSVSHNMEKVSDIIVKNINKKEAGVFTVDPVLCLRD